MQRDPDRGHEDERGERGHDERHRHERRAELARGYDHHFVHPEWVPELKRKYGLKLLGED